MPEAGNPLWTRHVHALFPAKDEGALETLFEAGESAQALLDHPGYKVLRKMLIAEIVATTQTVEARTLREPMSQAEFAGHLARCGALREVDDAVRAVLLLAERRRAEQAAKHEEAALAA